MIEISVDLEEDLLNGRESSATARFSAERLQVAVKRMLNDVPNSKRNGKAKTLSELT